MVLTKKNRSGYAIFVIFFMFPAVGGQLRAVVHIKSCFTESIA